MLRCVCYLILLWTRDQTHLAPRHFDSRPSQKTRRNGAPTVLVMPARSKAWATRPPGSRHPDAGRQAGIAGSVATAAQLLPLVLRH